MVRWWGRYVVSFVVWCNRDVLDRIQSSVLYVLSRLSDTWCCHGVQKKKTSARPVRRNLSWANTAADIEQSKAGIKRGLLHSSLVLPTNKITHFYQFCFLISASWDREETERTKGRDSKRRVREGGRSPTLQSAELFPGTDCCPGRVI